MFPWVIGVLGSANLVPLQSAGQGGSRKMAVALLGVHTPPKNPGSISGMQAYIACSFHL
jgi:hypothetical protein